MMIERTGTLIAIEGIDGCGKATQVKLLEKWIRETLKYDNITVVEFPRYDSVTAEPIKSYLRGDFGDIPDNIGPYTAASMFAVDRAISFKKDEWGDVYRSGGIVLADRYVLSNIIHQGSKFVDELGEKGYGGSLSRYDDFVRWIIDLEFEHMVPVPTMTVIIEPPRNDIRALIKHRKVNSVDGDIHEHNPEHLFKSRTSLGWFIDTWGGYGVQYSNDIVVVPLEGDAGEIRSKSDIHSDIREALRPCIMEAISGKD